MEGKTNDTEIFSNTTDFLKSMRHPHIPELVVVRSDSQLVSKSGLNLDPSLEVMLCQPMNPVRINNMVITASTHIGRRKNQEDRFVVAPSLLGGELLFAAVFDGTVREYASEFVRANVLNVLYSCPSFIKFADLSPSARADRGGSRKLFQMAIIEFYREMDTRLLAYCAENEYHYTSTTAVTTLLHIPSQTVYVAHLADSHAAIAIPFREGAPRAGADPNDAFLGQFLTRPHRPDNPDELRRIEASGGSLVYLHGSRPFIRGGDFHQRQLAMQLNYSRALGGKDLKPYGLIADPTIRIIDTRLPLYNKGGHSPLSRPGEEVFMVVLGSDGIWDVLSPQVVMNRAAADLHAYTANLADSSPKDAKVEPFDPAIMEESPLNPAARLVAEAIHGHVQRNTGDNCTSIIIYIDPAPAEE
jgi:protein phosphatase